MMLYKFIFMCSVISLFNLSLNAQKSLKVEQSERKEINYFNRGERNSYQLSSNINLEYALDINKFSVDLIYLPENSVRQTVSKRGDNWILDFYIKDSLIYYLFFDRLICLNINERNLTFENMQSKILQEVKFNFKYDRISFVKNKIVLTSHLNRIYPMEKQGKIRYLVLNSNTFKVEVENNINIDAIGFAHLPSYLISVGNFGISVTNCLKDEIYMYNFNDTIPYQIIGDKKRLNIGLDTIPFTLDSIKNMRLYAGRISQFGKTIDRVEGVIQISDTILIQVIKKANNSKMKELIFYKYSKNQNKWFKDKVFKFNNKLTNYRKYGLLRFDTSYFYCPGNNEIWLLNHFIPEKKRSVLGLFLYVKKLNKKVGYDSINEGLYKYKLVF